MTTSPRNILSSTPNPYRHKSYTVSLVQEIILNQQAFLFGLRYVPDKLLLDHEALANYLVQALVDKPEKAEILAHDILEDIMNQTIPKWIEVSLRQKQNKFGQNILVTIEDHQPGWEGDDLLQRIPLVFEKN